MYIVVKVSIIMDSLLLDSAEPLLCGRTYHFLSLPLLTFNKNISEVFSPTDPLPTPHTS
jgi:hypothetical protein